MAGLFNGIVFNVTLAYNVVMTKITSRSWYNRIDENVILGALPLRSMVEELIEKENIKGVISMNEDFELANWSFDGKGWEQFNVRFLQLRTQDFYESPSQENLLKGIEFIDKIKNETQNEGTIYVHCKAGRTRSATLVACYLMKKHKINPDESIKIMTEKRPHILLREIQLESLNEFYEKNVS